jgi:hypothetical protein
MAAARRRAPLKRFLPNAGQAAFDRVFDGATRHGHAGGWVPRPWAFETTVMALRLGPWPLLERMPVQVETLSAPPTQSCGRCSRPHRTTSPRRSAVPCARHVRSWREGKCGASWGGELAGRWRARGGTARLPCLCLTWWAHEAIRAPARGRGLGDGRSPSRPVRVSWSPSRGAGACGLGGGASRAPAPRSGAPAPGSAGALARVPRGCVSRHRPAQTAPAQWPAPGA